jgi:hypothetical protein
MAQRIELYTNDPHRPCEALGEVTASARALSSLQPEPAAEQVDRKLSAQAHAIGANGVINIQYQRHTDAHQARVLTARGIAVRFMEGAAESSSSSAAGRPASLFRSEVPTLPESAYRGVPSLSEPAQTQTWHPPAEIFMRPLPQSAPEPRPAPPPMQTAPSFPYRASPQEPSRIPIESRPPHSSQGPQAPRVHATRPPSSRPGEPTFQSLPPSLDKPLFRSWGMQYRGGVERPMDSASSTPMSFLIGLLTRKYQSSGTAQHGNESKQVTVSGGPMTGCAVLVVLGMVILFFTVFMSVISGLVRMMNQ